MTESPASAEVPTEVIEAFKTLNKYRAEILATEFQERGIPADQTIIRAYLNDFPELLPPELHILETIPVNPNLFHDVDTPEDAQDELWNFWEQAETTFLQRFKSEDQKTLLQFTTQGKGKIFNNIATFRMLYLFYTATKNPLETNRLGQDAEEMKKLSSYFLKRVRENMYAFHLPENEGLMQDLSHNAHVVLKTYALPNFDRYFQTLDRIGASADNHTLAVDARAAIEFASRAPEIRETFSALTVDDVTAILFDLLGKAAEFGLNIKAPN